MPSTLAAAGNEAKRGPWGSVAILRPLLRALAWAGSLVAVVGVAGLIVTIQYLAAALALTGRAGSAPAPTCLVYVCFLMLGLAFGATAWLTRQWLRSPRGCEPWPLPFAAARSWAAGGRLGVPGTRE